MCRQKRSEARKIIRTQGEMNHVNHHLEIIERARRRPSNLYSPSLTQLNMQFIGLGAFQVLRTQMGVGGINFSGKKRYEGVRFNVISVTRSNFQTKSVT